MLSLKLPTASHTYRLVEGIFGTKMGTSDKFQLTNNSKQLKKNPNNNNKFYYNHFSFHLTVEYIELYKFCL